MYLAGNETTELFHDKTMYNGKTNYRQGRYGKQFKV